MSSDTPDTPHPTGPPDRPHRSHPREELGAYVLGALEPAERHAVEGHLEDCPACRDEVARLSAVRPLLDRIDAAEAADDRLLPPADLAPRVVLSAAAAAGRLRRQVVRWRLATAASTAAALIVGAAVWAPWEPEPDRVVAAVAPLAADATATDGTVAAYAWEWGTTLELDVAGLPPRDAYVLWAVAADGRRERAGTWGPTATRGARVRGATAITRDDLRQVEVTDARGEPLFDAAFSPARASGR